MSFPGARAGPGGRTLLHGGAWAGGLRSRTHRRHPSLGSIGYFVQSCSLPGVNRETAQKDGRNIRFKCKAFDLCSRNWQEPRRATTSWISFAAAACVGLGERQEWELRRAAPPPSPMPWGTPGSMLEKAEEGQEP